MWSDDVESGENGWTPEVESLSTPRARAGSSTTARWTTAVLPGRVAQPRRLRQGPRTPYSTNFFVDGEWNVNRTPYNAPGMLVWQRDSAYSFNDVDAHLFDAPSIGSKGQLLLVDTHFDPRGCKGRPRRRTRA